MEAEKVLKNPGRTDQEKLLWMAFFTPGLNGRRGLPYVLVGQPGTVKTSTFNKLAKKGGLYFESIIGSLRPPTDFMGMPVPMKVPITKDNQFLDPSMEREEAVLMNYAPAGFAVRAAQHVRSLLLFDEANTAPPSVQAAMLRVLFEGMVGELELPPGVRMMLAMNHTDEAAGGWDIAPPLANRVGWIKWEHPTAAQFSEYLMGGGKQKEEAPVDPKVEEAMVDALWPQAWAEAAGDIAGFVTARPELLHKMPKDASRASAAWPSCRTVDFAAHAHAGCAVYGLPDAIRELAMGAFVGQDWYGEFHTWRSTADLPNPYDVLDGKVQFKHKASRLDRTAAVCTAATSLILDAKLPDRKNRIENLWKLHESLAQQAPDLSLPSVVSLCEQRLMLGSQVAYKVLAKMEPVLSAAGITKIT